ncbi:flagellar basal body P-ring formation chaperone FlgA [Tabrizicola soli]|uniref:Flagella basal body P-ring formation protein FlgA n=1 Tax=Tabrizicola soli TaxID=2185115 RepID=A0ABV7DU78_9RHOB|nr:flagellar basal body P-ring formation chaperone FlgA [Tabrizicola soli]
MRSLIALLLLTAPALAESLVATRTIRAQSVIAAEDVALVEAALPAALDDPGLAIGLEARVAIHAGRPVRAKDLAAPALVERNQLVKLFFLSGGLAIATEGRALARGAEGEVIRALNLASRTTVRGRVGPDGALYVGWTE